MNTVNVSTGFASFQLCMGRRPRVIPPLFNTAVDTVAQTFPDEVELAADGIRRIEVDILEAEDNLSIAKVEQAQAANAFRGEDQKFEGGEEVLLWTLNRHREYIQKDDNQVAKFMAHYDGPFKIKKAFSNTSSYMLDLPHAMKIFPTFHASMLRRYLNSNTETFPSRHRDRPPPMITEDEVEEQVERILDRRPCGRGYQ